MKDYMMIFIGANYEDIGLSPEQLQDRMGRWFTWGDKMQEKGILKGGHALKSQAKRITDTEKTITDGPFAESKELVGGYYIISAENYDDAMEVAKDYPDFDLGGTVEVREVMVFEK